MIFRGRAGGIIAFVMICLLAFAVFVGAAFLLINLLDPQQNTEPSMSLFGPEPTTPDFSELTDATYTTEATEQTDPTEPSDPTVSRGFFGDTLQEDEQACYDAIIEAVKAHQPSVQIDTPLTSDHVCKAAEAVYYDHPELFWLENAFSVSSSGSGQQLYLRYNMDAEESEQTKQRIEAEVGDLLNGLQDKTDYEKVKGVYEYLILSAEYDSELRPEQSMVPVLLKKAGVCASYAKSTEYLLQQLGMECGYVVGDTEGDSHAWNIVKIDGEWYHVDTTWGDPEGYPEDYISYVYLCLTSAELLRERTFDTEFAFPNCTATEYDFFRMNGLYAESYDKQAVLDYILENSTSGGEFYVKFANQEDYAQAYKELLEGKGIRDAADRGYSYQYYDDLYCFCGVFS